MSSVNPYNVLGPIILGGMALTFLIVAVQVVGKPHFRVVTQQVSPTEWIYTIYGGDGLEFAHSAGGFTSEKAAKAAGKLYIESFLDPEKP